MTDERLEWHMGNWADYAKAGRHVKGWPSKCIGLQSGASKDFDEMVEAEDKKCAEAVDAIVWGLPIIQRDAINARYLKAIWLITPPERAEVMASARLAIKIGLRARYIS